MAISTTTILAKQASGRPAVRVLDQKRRALNKTRHARIARVHRLKRVSKDVAFSTDVFPSPSLKTLALGMSSSNTSHTSLHSVAMGDDTCPSPIQQTPPPCQTLPFELLSMIFTMYIEAEPKRTRPPSLASRFPAVSPHTGADPTVLGQVCSYWRSVAISTPFLWNTLFIRKPRLSHIERANLWLSRASPLPVSIHLEGSKNDRMSPTELTASRALMDIFVKYMPAWKDITLVCSSDVLICVPDLVSMIPTNSASPSPCPLLQHAALQIQQSEEFLDMDTTCSRIDNVWSILHSSPSLRSAFWGDFYSYEIPQHAPWERLEVVRIDTPTDLSELLPILSRCTSAKEIAISNLSEPLPSFTLPASPIKLPNLQKLSVAMSQPSSDDFFASLTLPSLRALSLLHYDPESARRYPTSFRDFLSRSECPLATFEFVDECLDDDDLLGYLSSPWLRQVGQLGVDIRGSHISDRVIERLTAREDKSEPDMMPRLSVIELAVCSTTDGVLSKMVESRRRTANGGLSFVSFLAELGDGHPQDLAVLERLDEEDGLDWKLAFLDERMRMEAFDEF